MTSRRSLGDAVNTARWTERLITALFAALIFLIVATLFGALVWMCVFVWMAVV